MTPKQRGKPGSDHERFWRYLWGDFLAHWETSSIGAENESRALVSIDRANAVVWISARRLIDWAALQCGSV